jgi:hypothetical protein
MGDAAESAALFGLGMEALASVAPAQIGGS